MEKDAAAKLDGFDKATFLATNYKSTEQGKQAVALVAELKKDETFRKELAARSAYQTAMRTPANRRETSLKSVAKKFAGTHYGELAAKSPAG
jgi:hypothetical protein